MRRLFVVWKPIPERTLHGRKKALATFYVAKISDILWALKQVMKYRDFYFLFHYKLPKLKNIKPSNVGLYLT